MLIITEIDQKQTTVPIITEIDQKQTTVLIITEIDQKQTRQRRSHEIHRDINNTNYDRKYIKY